MPEPKMPDSKKSLKDLATELAKINKELDKTKDAGGKKRGAKELETGALTHILDSLARSMDLVKTLLEKGSEDNCPKVKVLEEKTRMLEDQSDHHHQRSLKGKFMISSLKNNNIIASEVKLKEGGKSTPRYVTELIFNKLGVRVKALRLPQVLSKPRKTAQQCTGGVACCPWLISNLPIHLYHLIL